MTTSGGKLKRRARRYAAVPVLIARNPSAARDALGWLGSLVGDQRLEPIEARRPWMNYGGQRWLARTVKAGWRVLEYGSGGSTLWLEDRGCETIAIEHDPEWADLVERHCNGRTTLIRRQLGEGYATPPDGTFDLVIVDGRRRVECALAAWERLHPGGWLVLDNSGRAHYTDVFEALGPGHTVSGVVPHRTYVDQTTVWQR